jgi:hypothetical protein
VAFAADACPNARRSREGTRYSATIKTRYRRYVKKNARVVRSIQCSSRASAEVIDKSKHPNPFWSAYGDVKPPKLISQVAFEANHEHLRRLALLQPGERAMPGDLYEYVRDLLYTKVDAPLLQYLIPFCLEAWREDLRGISGDYAGFVEWLYPALADRGIFEDHLTPEQVAAVSDFMRQTILDEIDDQRGLSYRAAKARPYRWVRALASYGVVLPHVDRLWAAWWSLDTIGRAVAAVQYISCFLYSQYENSVFAPWTPSQGGGPPGLWEFDGHLCKHRWLQPNVDFLRSALSVGWATDGLARAAGRLVGRPEHPVAIGVEGDLPLCVETLKLRCFELPQVLESPERTHTQFEWTV